MPCVLSICYLPDEVKTMVKCDSYAVTRMGRGKADGKPRKRLVTTVLLLAIVGALFFLYSRKSGSSSIEYGSKSLKFGGDDSAIPKTIPVSYLSLN